MKIERISNREYSVASNTRPKTHTVTDIGDDFYTCTCEWFSYRNAECRHIKAVRQLVKDLPIESPVESELGVANY